MSGQEARFQGLGVGPGIARGIVFIHHPEDEEPPKRRVDASDIANEIIRFESALIATRAQILEMQQRIAEAIQDFDAAERLSPPGSRHAAEARRFRSQLGR